MIMLRDRIKSRRLRRPHRRLRRVSTLPALLTIVHLLCGFAAIHFAAKATTRSVAADAERSAVEASEGTAEPPVGSIQAPEVNNPMLAYLAPSLLGLSCYLIFLAMIADGLDGAVARWTRSASEFGGQLDSLADVISFGAAPAFIVIALLQRYAFTDHAWAPDPLSEAVMGRIAWLMAASFVACAALRLARFNVENSPDPDAHLWFRGLPSPGAAGALVSLVILHEELSDTWVSPVLVKVLPLAALALALLMVSRVRYPHVLNQYLRGRRSFGHLVKIVLVLVMLVVYLQATMAILLCAYALWGPILHVVRRPQPKPAAAVATDGEDPGAVPPDRE